MKSRLMFVKLYGMDRVIKDVSNLDFKIKKIKSLVLLSNSKRKIFSKMKGYKIVDNNDPVIIPHPLFSCGTHNVLKFKEDDFNVGVVLDLESENMEVLVNSTTLNLAEYPKYLLMEVYYE